MNKVNSNDRVNTNSNNETNKTKTSLTTKVANLLSKMKIWKHRKVYSVNAADYLDNQTTIPKGESIGNMKIISSPILKLEDHIKTLQTADTNFLQNLETDAAIAALPYHQEITNINAIADSSWVKCTADRFEALEQSFRFDTDFDNAKYYPDEGKIVDKKTGFTAYIIENAATQEVRLVFGGTTSGKHSGGLFKRIIKNRKSTAYQWGANFKNVFNAKEIPRSYLQAQKLTSELSELLNNNNKIGRHNFQLTLSGHSKGAAEATFASLMLPKPCKTICFSSAELGKASLNAINNSSNDNISKANEYITNYFIKNDIVPNVSNVFRGLYKIGKFYQIPNDGKTIDKHDKFFKHIHSFVSKARATYVKKSDN